MKPYLTESGMFDGCLDDREPNIGCIFDLVFSRSCFDRLYVDICWNLTVGTRTDIMNVFIRWSPIGQLEIEMCEGERFNDTPHKVLIQEGLEL
jgi:hypothetical protein